MTKHQKKNGAQHKSGKQLEREKLNRKIKAMAHKPNTVESLKTAALAYEHLAASTSNPNFDKKPNYNPDTRILLVGDGDFSFSKSLALLMMPMLKKNQKFKIVATSYDNFGELVSKYGSAVKANTAELRKIPGVVVMHSVDATRLDSDPRLQAYEFDRIIFNFPHMGGSQDADVAANQNMLSAFFAAGRKMLPRDPTKGEIHIALRDTSFYNKWNLPKLAETSGCVKLVSKKPFDTGPFVARGYIAVRTNPATREAPSLENAIKYTLAPLTSQNAKDRALPRSFEGHWPVVEETATGAKVVKEESEDEEESDAGEMDMTLRELMGLD